MQYTWTTLSPQALSSLFFQKHTLSLGNSGKSCTHARLPILALVVRSSLTRRQCADVRFWAGVAVGWITNPDGKMNSVFQLSYRIAPAHSGAKLVGVGEKGVVRRQTAWSRLRGSHWTELRWSRTQHPLKT